jgi:flagellar assembly factor FliW
MPNITILKQQISYDEADVITFPEGLIGLPRLRRMVLVRRPDLAPFLWLASLDDSAVAFVVTDPRALFDGYAEDEEVRQLTTSGNCESLLLSIVLVSEDWTQSSINLRAPLVVCPRAMTGRQAVLSGGARRIDEPLRKASAA